MRSIPQPCPNCRDCSGMRTKVASASTAIERQALQILAAERAGNRRALGRAKILAAKRTRITRFDLAGAVARNFCSPVRLLTGPASHYTLRILSDTITARFYSKSDPPRPVVFRCRMTEPISRWLMQGVHHGIERASIPSDVSTTSGHIFPLAAAECRVRFHRSHGGWSLWHWWGQMLPTWGRNRCQRHNSSRICSAKRTSIAEIAAILSAATAHVPRATMSLRLRASR
jgi:hypothetical protein